MGWTIILENENGNAIRTLEFEFNYELLMKLDLTKYMLLKYINPFGDTVFNCLQISDLINDLIELKKEVPQLNQEIIGIIDIARECGNKIHTYLKFYGD